MMKDVLSRRTISPKELKARGWERNSRPAAGVFCDRNYTHKDGWKIEHCGHPTANWPYLLIDPAGRWILTGAAFGNSPEFGTAWPTVASAVEYVATQTQKGGAA